MALTSSVCRVQWVRDRFALKERLLQSFYEREPKRTPKIASAGQSSADPGLWPQEVPMRSLNSNMVNFGVFFSLQLATIVGLIASKAFCWFVALIVISYVVITAVKGYDQLELMLHEANILQGTPPFSETGVVSKKRD